VLVGAANTHTEALKHDFGGRDIHFVENTPDVATEMAAADLAVATVGGTVWELAAAGVPGLVISTTPTQHRIGESLHQYGAHRWVGDARSLGRESLAESLGELVENADLRTEMARLGRTLVDGKGAARTASAILDGSSDWQFRPAAPEDAEPVWEIASDATVRSESFNTDAFTFASHERWFSERLARPTQRMWVAERDSSIGAYIRYDATPPWAMVSIAVGRPMRGRGLAEQLLSATWADACRALGARAARGVVFETNMASARAFERAGFSAVDRPCLEGQRCIMFERSVDRQAIC
jgi:L-amino acid N-acyltransferase YncA